MWSPKLQSFERPTDTDALKQDQASPRTGDLFGKRGQRELVDIGPMLQGRISKCVCVEAGGP